MKFNKEEVALLFSQIGEYFWYPSPDLLFGETVGS